MARKATTTTAPPCACLPTSPNPSSTTTPTTPATNSPFSPSTTSSSSSSYVQSPLSHYPRPRSSVPFSWEAQPGVPKHAHLQPPPSTRTPLRPPPSSSNSDLLRALRRRGSSRTAAGATNTPHDPVFVRDPFAVALAECCSETHNFNYLLDVGDDDAYYDAPAGGGSRRWAAEYYCSPLVTNKVGATAGSGSRRWGAAQYYCSPPRVHSKAPAGGSSSRLQLFGSLFGLRSLHGSCKTASAVADSISSVPSRPISAGRFRSTGSTSASSSSFSRSDSIGLNRCRRAR